MKNMEKWQNLWLYFCHLGWCSIYVFWTRIAFLNKRLEFFEKTLFLGNGSYKLEEFYKKLYDKLKSENPALRGGDSNATTKILQNLQTNAPDKVLAYLRKKMEMMRFVILNLSETQHLKITDFR